MTGRDVIPRYGGMLFGVGATLGLVFFLVLPHRAEEVNSTGILATLFASYVVAAILLAGGGRFGKWVTQPVTIFGTLTISAGIYFLGDSQTSIFMFYLSPVLFSAYFFKRRQAILQLLVVGLSYGVVLAALEPTTSSLSRWVIVTCWMATAGAFVGFLKSRIGRLVDRLAEAARTDPLTGLLNRRGFEEAFEMELGRARRHQRPLSLLMGDLDDFKEVNDRLGHRAGDDMLEIVSEVLKGAKRKTDIVGRLGGEEFALLVTDSNEAKGYSVAERLRSSVQDACKGEPVPITISIGIASYPTHGDTAESLYQAADRALYGAKALGRDRSVVYGPEIAGTGPSSARQASEGDARLATVLALVETLDIRDSGTARHSQTVGAYAEMTARAIGLPATVIERVRIAGVLHDVGKIGISDRVLCKPAPLTAEEWREMKRHPEIGARILENANLDDIREWVLCHQERVDGSGYPRGLEITDIPLEARIVAVADAYEAMTSDRGYRAALGHDAARLELTSCAGSQFDKHVVDVFLRAMESEGLDRVEATLQEYSRNGSLARINAEGADLRSAVGE